MRNYSLVLVAATLCAALPVPVLATNTSFLPGDAFFHAELTTELLARLETETSPVFGYVRARNAELNLCGYAGFGRLKYEDMPLSMRQNLVKLGRYVRRWHGHPVFEQWSDPETGEARQRELNAPHLFIYNPDFRGRIGLKFNENWMEHTARYESFVTDFRLVAEEWKRSADVPALKIETPFELVGGKKPVDVQRENPFGTTPSGGPLIEEPVTVRGPMKLIVIPRHGRQPSKTEPELNNVALEKNGTIIYVVTVDGITGKRVRHGDWVDFDPFADENETTGDAKGR